MNWYERQRLRSAYGEFCEQMGVTHAVTLATHQDWSISKTTKLLKQFCARMDDIHLGSTWSREPLDKRMNGLFHIEGTQHGKHFHAHGLIRFPYGNESGRKMLIEYFWRGLCPSGTIDVKKLWSNNFATYASKEMRKRDYTSDRLVLVADFMSEKTLSALAK